MFGDLGGIKFPIRANFRADVSEWSTGWEAGIPAVGPPEPVGAASRTPLGHRVLVFILRNPL